MTNAELIAKIKAEIERRKSLLTQHSRLTYDLILDMCIKEYDDLISFISTLEEPPSDDLEEAANKYSEKLTSEPYLQIVHKTDFIAGAKWQKSQMMKGAVEGELEYNYDENGRAYYSIRPTWITGKIGDKVHIIIVKEDSNE